MPRRKVHRGDSFGGLAYRINVTAESGVYAEHMARVAEHVEAGYSKGRWTVVHVRYVLGDGATNQMLLNAARSRFGTENVRYVWALELSKQDDGHKHYHLALFIESREVNMRAVTTLLHELRERGVLHHYKRMTPKPEKVPHEVLMELDGDELDDAISDYGLTIKNMSAVRFAIYWLSYLAKVKTKVLDARSFGSTSLPSDWRETATRLPV